MSEHQDQNEEQLTPPEDRVKLWTSWVEGHSSQRAGEELARKEMLAETDSLTGLLNSRGLNNRMSISERYHQSSGNHYSLVFIDLNFLGLVNDKVSHDQGNEIIKSLAKAIKNSIEKDTLVGRWTEGDEFLIFLPNNSKEKGIEIVDKIKTNWETPFLGSFGVAEWDGTSTLQEIVSLAEQEMYKDKKARKGVK